MWFHYFFYFLYNHYGKPKWKEQNIPFFSTVLGIAALQIINFAAVKDFILFHLLNSRNLYFKNDTFIVPTVFIAFNFWYFWHGTRYKHILKQFNNRTKEEKQPYRIVSWIYIVVSILFVILMGYTVRNNIKWW